MKYPKVAIIISTFNQEKLLEKCLKSLRKKTDYENYKVFLIDDSGKGDIGRNIRKKFGWVNVSINKKNLGFSKSNNIGIEKTLKNYNPYYILLLNDDTEIVDRNWLKKMVEVGESDKKIGILGCKVVYPDGNVQWVKNDTSSAIKEVYNVIGACFMIKRSVIEEIGLLDEKFSPVYGEESDFCFRALKKGFRLIYVGKTKILHHGSVSTKTIFNEKIWFLKKKHGIRLEWLNFDFSKIIKYGFIHMGSAILSDRPIKKSKALIKAYLENIKDFKEIKMKRNERHEWRN